jgi:hypothetical protein
MKTLRIVTGGIVATAVAGTGLWLGAGPAGAVPDVVDRPYSDAKTMIQQAGGSAVVATRTGGGLDESKCLVTNAWEAPYQRIVRGGMTANDEVLVALNCNGALAGPGASGNSMASPAGRQAKSEAEEKAEAQEEQELAEAATPNE